MKVSKENAELKAGYSCCECFTDQLVYIIDIRVKKYCTGLPDRYIN